jgi:pre-mRNA-splicing factor RBM22/SLT11
VRDLDLKVDVHTRDTALGLKDSIAKTKLNREGYVVNAEKNMNANDGKGTTGAFAHLGAPSREMMKKITETEPYKRLTKQVKKANLLQPPADENIKSLFLLQVHADLSDGDIKMWFERFGEVKSVVVSRKTQCAFVNYTTRLAAESAASSVEDSGCEINNHKVTVQWVKPKS